MTDAEREAQIRQRATESFDRTCVEPGISHARLDRVELLGRLDEARAEIARLTGNLKNNGHNEPCYYCGEPCNDLAGNPGLWSLCLSHPEEPGVAKYHHATCIYERLDALAQLQTPPSGWRLSRLWNQSPQIENDNDWMAEFQNGTQNRYMRNTDGPVGHASPLEALAAARARICAAKSA